MPWVEFKEEFPFKPETRVTIVYPAGFVGLVKADCASAAISAGKAIGLPTPRKSDGDIRKSNRSGKASQEA
ncbi:MAG TPA: hypothetical protein DD739_12105 [Ochrobactrum anthropi]|nr:hypothetical protein [Brucella anthropi]